MDKVKEFYEELDELYDEGNIREVEMFLSRKLAQNIPCCGQFNEIQLACESELGALYRGAGRYKDSMLHFFKAGELIRKHFGDDSADYATNLNNIAGLYRLMGDNSSALTTFARAKAIYETTVGKNSTLYASVLNNMALLYQTKKEYDKALEYLKKALDIVGTHEETKEETATSYVNLGTLYFKCGDNAKAKQAINTAKQMFDEIGNAGVHYIAAENCLATIAFSEGEFENAKELFKKVADSTKSFFGKNAEYASACDGLARCLVKLKDYASAKDYMSEAATVYAKVFGENSDIAKMAKLNAEKIAERI